VRIIVGASVARYHALPGRVEHRLAYVVGLERLGHEVYLVDDLGSKPLADDRGNDVPFRAWPGRRRFETIARRYGIWGRAAVIHGPERSTHGVAYEQLVRLADTADVLVNIQGKLQDPELVERVGTRVYVDGAPGYTQVYDSVYGIDQRVRGHDVHFTYGVNIGTPGCPIPDCGVDWQPLVPPIVLDEWPAKPPPRSGRFTSVSRWDSDPTFELDGRHSGRKRDNWRRYRELPRQAEQPLELALRIHPGYANELRAFERSGWVLTDVGRIRTLAQYADYIRRSRGEFSVANSRYVEFRTGWFSERSVRYLASGRPVVVQSTGFEDHIPSGLGIVTFSSPDEAVEALGAVASDYRRHCKAARELAEEYFDSGKVLTRLLAGAAVPA
jgi:hypothetical protein